LSLGNNKNYWVFYCDTMQYNLNCLQLLRAWGSNDLFATFYT
jgi:hypothetical protein